MKRTYLTSIALGMALIMSSCGGGDSTKSTTETKKTESTKTEKAETVPNKVSLEIAGNDQMKFDKDKLSVYEGQEVTLTLTHSGEMTKEAMGHNWVLLKVGVSMSDFAQASTDDPENQYVDPEREGDVIARTEVIGGGETTSITFTAPAVGSYKYICSFPGHFGMMQGTFKVMKKP